MDEGGEKIKERKERETDGRSKVEKDAIEMEEGTSNNQQSWFPPEQEKGNNVNDVSAKWNEFEQREQHESTDQDRKSNLASGKKGQAPEPYQPETSEYQDSKKTSMDQNKSWNQQIVNAERQGREAGRAEALTSLQNMLLNNMNEIRSTLSQSQMGTSERREQDGLVETMHGRHPGLAGRSSFNKPAGGGRGGGPGAGPNLRRLSTTSRNQQAEPNQNGPTFNGPDRFPGGLEMMPEGQLSLGGNQPTQVEDSHGSALPTICDDATAEGSRHSESYFGSDAANVSFIDKAEGQAVNNLMTRIRLRFKEFFAEFIACVLLLLVGASVDAQVQLSERLTPQNQAGSYPSQNWAWGLAVMCTIHLAGGISGAHCNPGITISLAVFRGFPWRMVWVYLLAQYLGCFCGAGLAYAIYQPAINLYEGHGLRTIVGQNATGGFFTTVPSITSTSASAFGTELCASSILGAMVLAIGDDSNSPPGDGMSALILGLTVTMIGMSLGWNTGYPINPARDLGPRIFLSIAGYGSDVWTHDNYWWTYGGQVATYLGTLFGCFLYDLFLYHGRHSPLNTVIHWRWQKARQIVVNLLTKFSSGHRKQSKEKHQDFKGSPGSLEQQTNAKQQQPTDASLTKDAIEKSWAQEKK